MINRCLLSFILIIVFFSNLLPSDNISFKVVKQTNLSLTIEAYFPPDLYNNEKLVEGNFLSIKGAPLFQQENYPVVPVVTKMFSLPGEKVEFTIINIVKKRMNIKKYLINTHGNKRPDARADENYQAKKKDFVEISYQGLFRDVPIFNLNIFPVKVDINSNDIEYLESITIEIKLSSQLQKITTQFKTKNRYGNEKSLLNKLLLNGSNVNYEATPLVTGKILNSNTIGPQVITQRFKQGRYKILLYETGLYQITYSDLVNANVPVNQFNTRRLKITNKGQEIPIYFYGGGDGSFDSGDYFEFWGEKNKSPFVNDYPDVYTDPFSDQNVYWLEIGDKNGLRLVEENGAIIVTNPGGYYTQTNFKETLHFEEDNYYERFGHNGANLNNPGYTIDHWFYDNGLSAKTNTAYKMFIPYPFEQGGSVYAKVVMRGLSFKTDLNPLQNHVVDITLNDNGDVGSSGLWKDQELHIVANTIPIPQAEIHHGENDLKIHMDQVGVADRILLNWFDITYQRKYRAYGNIVKFKKDLSKPIDRISQFEIDGFNNPQIEIFKLGISKIVNGRIVYSTAPDGLTSYRVSFQDEIFYPDIEYVAITPDAKKKPIEIIEDTPWNTQNTEPSLLDNLNSAEYVIITEKSFYDNVLDLKTYREQNGLKVEVVKVEDIYDEFNFGIKSPLAIRKFLKYAYENWDSTNKLLYVVLIGDASEDYKNNRTLKKDYVPTFIFETVLHGACASDYQYALISGDDLMPDLIISRIPVSSNPEFNAYFEKLQSYESESNIGEWRNKGLFISGNDSSTYEYYSGSPVFRAQNQRLINLCMPDGYFTRKLNTVKDKSIAIDPNFGGTTALINYWDHGLSLINFFGHGGGGIWSDVSLLDLNDIDRLNNGSHLPFICSMTCFTGSFESRSLQGLMKKLLIRPNGGAIGALAASGFGWTYNDFALGWFANDFLVNDDLTVGEAILFAKLFYLNNNIYVTDNYDTGIPSYSSLKHTMVNHYNLLGDPYVSINIPNKSLKINVDNSLPNTGETINVTVESPYISGTGRLEMTNEKHEPILESNFSLTNATAQVSFEIPQGLDDQYLYVKAYASDNNVESRGFAKLAIGKALMDSVVTIPRNPQINDEITFYVYLKSSDEIESVRIYNSNSHSPPFSLELTEISDSLWSNQSPYIASDFSGLINFDIQIRDINSKNYLYRLNSVHIGDPRPDMEIVEGSYNFAGVTAVGLSLQVKNNSETPISQVELSFFKDTYLPSSLPETSIVVDFAAQEQKNIFIKIDDSLLVYNKKFIAVLDASNNIDERNEDNNLDSIRYDYSIFNVTVNLGTTLNGVDSDTIPIRDFGRFYIPPNSLSESSTLRFSVYENANLLDFKKQPGFEYLKFNGQPENQIVKLTLNNINTLISSAHPAYLEFFGESSPDSNVICRFIPKLNRWVASDTTVFNDKVYTLTESLGEFALFYITDSRDPSVEITINGRDLYDDMFIPRSPNIAIILQDANGINLSSGFSVLDGKGEILSSEINIPDSALNANAVSISATPTFSTGPNNLRVIVKDTRGNTTDVTKSFIVAENFELRVFGNYPNPFTDETIISFLIIADRALDRFAIKIYTVSGRMIRKITFNEEYPDENLLEPDYHEVPWNGRDADGNLVANGVYFAVIEAVYNQKSIKQTLKLAKLK